jgi:hypothetical protein
LRWRIPHLRGLLPVGAGAGAVAGGIFGHATVAAVVGGVGF